MGLKEECTLEYEGRTPSGTALLETEELIFRGSYRLKIPFASIHAVEDTSECLRVTFGDGQCASFFLPDPEMWARKIRSPKARIDKLGVTTKDVVALINLRDESLESEIRTKMANVSMRVSGKTTIIFLGANDRSDLDRLPDLRRQMHCDGAIWIVRPRGRKEITESDVMNLARKAGLVDVKVARYSATHTAEKLVTRLKDRQKSRSPG
ncbi:MAG: DUF3052 family protein [Acidobacteriota bacterium]